MGVETKVKVGLIGCGNIAPAYLKGCRAFHILEVVACADRVPNRASALAAQHNLRACSMEELLGDPEIQIVVNLTVPQAHAQVSLAAIQAGKHVYSEKPLAVTCEDGLRILQAARARGVLVGCAPDTFLGGGLQTCRHLVDQGHIGRPIAASAAMSSHGPESWHPNPEIFYQAGGGPLLDMGPYYLTALVSLLGPVQRVTASTRISLPERTITNPDRYGERIAVEVPTHVASLLEFEHGPVATLVTSFDIWTDHYAHLEVYGTEGSLRLPDPNTFGGPVHLYRPDAKRWEEVPLSHNADVGRGIGVADMAYALAYGRPHRASGELAYHVLEIMQAVADSSRTGRHIELTNRCARPAPLPLDLQPGLLDA